MRHAIRLAVVAATLLLFDTGATAQTVQKCVARGGQVRYQSEPCARGERTAEMWDATPDEAQPMVRTHTSSRRRSTSIAASRRNRSVAEFAADMPDACARARAYRNAAERRAGLARNYDLLSTLQARVFEACR